MSNYAKIENNVVVNVIVCDDSNISSINGQHIKITDSTGHPLVGSTWNENLNKFKLPSPWPSWQFDETAGAWISPAGENPDPATKYWDEDSLSWADRF